MNFQKSLKFLLETFFSINFELQLIYFKHLFNQDTTVNNEFSRKITGGALLKISKPDSVGVN